MGTLDTKLQKHMELLISRYPALEKCREDITAAYLVMEEAYERGGKLFIAGNGGSAADSEHIRQGASGLPKNLSAACLPSRLWRTRR